jgi:hypothetical protein
MNKIIFIPTTKNIELLVPPPKPAKNYIPQWYKNIEAVHIKNIKVSEGGSSNTNVKNCIPFLDGLTSGYIQETWTDIHIKNNGDSVNYNFSDFNSPEMMNHRPQQSITVGPEYHQSEFVWKQVWIPKLPNGYSYIFTHPLNRIDLPFTTTSVIVDADKLNYSISGNVPFYLKKDFEGIIPAGTPMYQMIPFRREPWSMELEEYNKDSISKGISGLRKNFIGSYKNRYWQKKEYN